MKGASLVALSYAEIPALSVLRGFASTVLGLSLSIWLLIELYRLLTRGQADFVTPVIRVGLGFAAVSALPSLGPAVAGMFETMGAKMGAEADLQLFGSAFSHALGQVEDQDVLTTMASFFSLRGLLAIMSLTLYLFVLLVKMAVIDVLWPICLGLTVVFGLIAVPLGVLPGFSTLGGWIRNLLEISLWPLVFQTVVAMMTGAFKATLRQVLEVEGVFGAALEGAADASALGSQLHIMVHFWALCVGYAVLCLGTPLLASMAVRSSPVSAVGQFVASTAAQLGATAVGAIGGAAGLARFAAGAADKLHSAARHYRVGAEASVWGQAAMRALSGGQGGGEATASPSATEANTPESRLSTAVIDRRRYAAAKEEGKGP